MDPSEPSPATGPSPPAPSPAADLVAAVRRLANTSVLVVGDVMLDRYVYGDVARISPEAPVPILSVTREIAVPGGAGNVVRNLTALGAAVAFVSVVGDDRRGVRPDRAWSAASPGWSRGCWCRAAAPPREDPLRRRGPGTAPLFRADREETAPIHPKLAERMLRIAARRDGGDLGHGAVGLPQGRAGRRRAGPADRRRRDRGGRRVIVDPRGRDHARYAGADVICRTGATWPQATAMPVDTDEAFVAAADGAARRHGFGAVLVTSADDGMTLVDAGHRAAFPRRGGRGLRRLRRRRHGAGGAGGRASRPASTCRSAVRLANARRRHRGGQGRHRGGAGGRPAGRAVAAARRAATRSCRARQRPSRSERWRRRGWRAGFKRLLRPAASRPRASAGAGAGRLRPAGGGAERRCQARGAEGPSRPVQPEAVRAALLAGLAASTWWWSAATRRR